MKRLLLIPIMAATMLAADARVFVTEHGKTYHQTRTCMSLSRALPEHVHQVDETAAVGHGLRKCGICYRAKSAKPKADTGWMKEGK